MLTIRKADHIPLRIFQRLEHHLLGGAVRRMAFGPAVVQNGCYDFLLCLGNILHLLRFGQGDCKLREGKLADIAPTMLKILGLPKPESMSGESIIL